ncbi:MAG: DUF4197 domain-containing protein [Bacteroidales bacterium]|nr:DUF4197 domain-containing protein [Bacteroidales bacterium]
MKTTRVLFSFFLFFAGIMLCNAQFPVSIKQILDPGKGGLSEKDAAAGIREALVKGTGASVAIVSKLDGYLGNQEIKIPFPPEAKEIESKLRAIGLGSQVDEVVVSLNRAAEDAAKSAEPVFVAAIKGMSISEAINIVKGNNDAATRYLEKTTSPELKVKFNPIIKTSLDKVDATRLWTELITKYNQIPFVKKQNPDLADYVTDKTITGLFVMVAKEEAKIRKDPAARVTELLKKVFGN